MNKLADHEKNELSAVEKFYWIQTFLSQIFFGWTIYLDIITIIEDVLVQNNISKYANKLQLNMECQRNLCSGSVFLNELPATKYPMETETKFFKKISNLPTICEMHAKLPNHKGFLIEQSSRNDCV